MSDITKFKVGNDTYNIKDEESRNTLVGKVDTDDIPDLVSDNLAKGILGNETVLSTDNVPFVSKIMSAGAYQRKKFVGCSFVWNQLVDIPASDKSKTLNGLTFTDNRDGSYSLQTDESGTTAQANIYMISISCKANHVYYLTGADGEHCAIYQGSTSQNTVNGLIWKETGDVTRNLTCIVASGKVITQKYTFFPKVHDLTQLFGSTAIADAIYNLEQATAGAGIAKLKELGFFTEDYYAYDAGSIQSVDIKEYSVTGKNLFNKNTAFVGYKLVNNGNIQTNQSFTASDYIGVIPGSQLYLSNVSGNQVADTCAEYDSQKRFIKNVSVSGSVKASGKITISSNTYYIRVNMNIANSDICQIEFGSTATAYEPYHKTTYPLTPTELRGFPVIDANNNIYCDGDEYASDGEVTRKCGIVDLGTLTWDAYTVESAAATTKNLRGIIPNTMNDKIGLIICPKYITTTFNDYTGVDKAIAVNAVGYVNIHDSNFVGKTSEEVKTYLSGTYLVYWKITPTTETLTPFDYPQSVGSLEEITDYKVEQEDRDVAIPTGHVTEYMGKGGEFTLPTLPETPSVLAFDGHNAYWEENTIDTVKALVNLVKALANENRRTRRDITNDLANLSQAVAEQNLGKYGYSIGDYFIGASGYTYVLADLNIFKGTTSKRISSNHLGIAVDTHATSQWHTGDVSAVGYAGSTLHSYLSSTVLNTIKTDFIALFGGTTGLEHLISHGKMLTTALSNIAWQSDQYISALSEIQIYGSNVWSANGYQTGEANKKLEVFNKFEYTDIFGNEFVYLRNIESGTLVCLADGNGAANHIAPSNAYYVVGLIIFA